MRKFCVLLILVIVTLGAKAQYQFTKLTDQTYTEIVNPDYVIYDTTILWGNVTTKPDMYFKTFGKQYYFKDGIFIPLKEGYLYFINQTHSTTVYAAKGDFQARPGKKQQSTFSFKTETFGGKKIFTAQWKNVGFKNGDSLSFINFQAKLAEDGERVEFHFGPSWVKNGLYENGANGPTIGILEMDASFNTIYNQLWLSGKPESPVVVNKNEIINLDATPGEGTVYRFAYATSDVKNMDKSNRISTLIATNNKIKINWNSQVTGNHDLLIYDLHGTLVFKKLVTSNDLEIDNFLTSGLYHVTIFNKDSYFNQKLFIP